MQRIQALLIGIDNYNKIGGLQGCVNDIIKVEHYLKQHVENIQVARLLDHQATKGAIVEAIGRINSVLAESDTFLLYFAGHGTREYADPVWKEPNGKLECLICYDDKPDVPSGFLLADKELRYLIQLLSNTGAHIVTIFDCCHSGGNTRNLELAPDNHGILPRRHSRTFPQREWNEFIFGPGISYNAIAGKHVNEILPQGTHVQIAACEADEVAFEIKGEGVFTKAFLKVLEDSGGNISYYSLRNRIRQYLRFVYQQQPRIYATGSSEEETQRLLFTRFLNFLPNDKHYFITEAVFNSRKGWVLNLGLIHGIHQDSIIYLTDPTEPHRRYKAEINGVFIDHCLLDLKEYSGVLSRYTVLKATIEGLQLSELKLHVNHNGDPEQIKTITEALSREASGYYKLDGDRSSADFELHVRPEFIYLTKRNDEFRPIARPVEFNRNNPDPSVIRQLSEYIKHISRWRYIQQLQNRSAIKPAKNAIKVSITQVCDDGRENIIVINESADGTAYADLQPFIKSNLRISLTNQTDQKLFIALAYLSYDFRVYTGLLEGRVELLYPGSIVQPGRRAKSSNTATNLVPLKLPDVVQEYNWKGYTETIKIFISHEEFDHEALTLDALPVAYTLHDRVFQKNTSRHFDFEDDEDEGIISTDWITQTIHLVYPNIFYNKIEQHKVNEMLTSDKMGFFAERLYGGRQSK